MSIDLYSEGLFDADERRFESENEDDPDEIERVIEGRVDDAENNSAGEGVDDGNPAQSINGGRVKEPAKKRVVQNPQPKLDAARLMGPRGLNVLKDYYKDFEFRGRGYEKEDLDRVMKRMEHWAHRMYPRFTFKDSLKQIERLGQKKIVQVHMHRIRTDTVLPEVTEQLFDDEEQRNDNDPDVVPVPPNPFDQLVDQRLPPVADIPTPPQPLQQEEEFRPTPEQIKRMEVNRQRAVEIRAARMKAQQDELNRKNNESTSDPLPQIPSANGMPPTTSPTSVEKDKLTDVGEVSTSLEKIALPETMSSEDEPMVPIPVGTETPSTNGMPPSTTPTCVEKDKLTDVGVVTTSQEKIALPETMSSENEPMVPIPVGTETPSTNGMPPSTTPTCVEKDKLTDVGVVSTPQEKSALPETMSSEDEPMEID